MPEPSEEPGDVAAASPGAASGPRSADVAHFRSVLGHFATGITIVTGAPRGYRGLHVPVLRGLSLDPR